jgi:hypothetical protein
MAKSRDRVEGVAGEVELGGRAPLAAAEQRLAPEEWCRRLGRGRELYRLGARAVWQPEWRHAAAVVLHGWHKHAHHAGEPMQLTRAQYEAALEAAGPSEGIPAPHPAALSPHANKLV